MFSIITGDTELALDTLPQKSCSERFLRRVHAAGQHAKELMRRLREANHDMDQQHRPVSLRQLLEDMFTLLRELLPDTIDIRSDLPEDIVISANPVQIRQMLINLCTNAERAMQTTGGMLEMCLKGIKVTRESSPLSQALVPGHYARLTVRDTGCGLESNILDRVFDPSFTTKREKEGHGMGLSMVQNIVREHQGVITAASTVGQGTVFEIYLPSVSNGDSSTITTPKTRNQIRFVQPEQADHYETRAELLPYRTVPLEDCQFESQRLAFYRSLSEKDRRRFAALEASKLGRGGISYIAHILGCDRHTITRGMKELTNAEAIRQTRIRQIGGGRKSKGGCNRLKV